VAIRVVRLGTARAPDEGLRLGTVRRPPRGIPRDRFARENFYDVWVPALAPSAPLVKAGLAAGSPGEWRRFQRRYRAEMNRPDARHVLDLLAALSHRADFSVGCYCQDEARCHRAVLRKLLAERDAALVT
jgi:uncharacterized protein YeaO (DUF488 family)